MKQWDEDALLAYLKARGTIWDTFEEACRLGDGTNGLPEATLSSGYLLRWIITLEMDMYGPDLAEAPPQDELVCFMAFPLATRARQCSCRHPSHLCSQHVMRATHVLRVGLAKLCLFGAVFSGSGSWSAQGSQRAARQKRSALRRDR